MLSWVIVMKRRIFITNTIVVVLALVALLLISSEVIRRVSDHYTSQAPPEEDPGAAQAAELLESWEDSGGWQELNLQLEALGYQLYAVRDGAEVFSSLSPLQSDLLRHGGIPASWPEGEAAELWNGAALLVGIQSGGYTLVAMSRPDLPEFFGRQRPQAEASLLSLLIIGAAAILLIVSLSLISTHFQVKHIMRPVNALADAARRVEAGDYTRPVGYGGQDEFTAVCAAFEQMQRHLLEEREKNAAYERARTDLVAGISHDLRTPLTSVQGYLKGLRDGVASTEEKRAQYVDIAYRKACDMEVLLQRLFDFSRMETGSLPMSPVRADLGEFVRDYIRGTEGELAQRGGRFVLRGAPAPHPVRMDTGQMGQFGFFYLAEYLNMFIIAAVATTMFLGGWQPLHISGWDGFNAVMDYIPSFVWFFGKTFFCVFLALWVRWTFPRLRIDQLLNLEWKVLMPICLVNLILMAIVVIL